MADPQLRVASTVDQLHEASERLSVSPAGLAPALVEPGIRLLVDGAGGAALLRRQWAGDGTAEAVVLHRAGVPLDHPVVLATAAGWGCDWLCHASTGRTVAVAGPPDDAPLADRFLHLAALAATRVEIAVALSRSGEAADEAAHVAAVAILRQLGLPVLSEERPDRPVVDGDPWIVLVPIDGTGNFPTGLPPWAFSAALVHRGRPVAGLVADLSSGRRWAAAEGAGAWRDGAPVRPRAGSTAVLPTAPVGETVAVPPEMRRVRITGSTALDLCLVADGSAASWHDLDRSGTHVYDVAGGLAVLLAAGGSALTPEGGPLALRPDTRELVRFVAAPSAAAVHKLLSALG